MVSITSETFFDALKTRRTNYDLKNESTIPDAQIQHIVSETLTHVPSAYNVQSARAVVLLGDNHRTLWQKAYDAAKPILPEAAWATFGPKIKGLEHSYGTVMFFEDQDALTVLGEKSPMTKPHIGVWSEESAGMHHFAVWTALAVEGMGGSLQHYNMIPGFSEIVAKTFNLPESWKLNAQLVFGVPASAPKDKTFLPIEERVKIIA